MFQFALVWYISNITLQVTDETWNSPPAQKHKASLKHNSQQIFAKWITSGTIIYTCFILTPSSIQKQNLSTGNVIKISLFILAQYFVQHKIFTFKGITLAGTWGKPVVNLHRQLQQFHILLTIIVLKICTDFLIICTGMSVPYSEISRAALVFEISCRIRASKLPCYTSYIANEKPLRNNIWVLYINVPIKLSFSEIDITNTPLLASGPAVTDDTRNQWASLAIHRDAELLFRSKKSGATWLAARCCHVAAESQSRLQLSWFECFHRVVHFENDHICSIEVLRHSSEKETPLAYVLAWEMPQ